MHHTFINTTSNICIYKSRDIRYIHFIDGSGLYCSDVKYGAQSLGNESCPVLEFVPTTRVQVAEDDQQAAASAALGAAAAKARILANREERQMKALVGQVRSTNVRRIIPHPLF